MMSPHNLHIVSIYNLIVDRRLYLDVWRSTQCVRRPGEDEWACCTLYTYEAEIHSVAPYGAVKSDAESALLIVS